MPEFMNALIQADDLPRLRDQDFVPVHPNYLRVRLLSIGVLATLIMIVGIVFAVMLPSDGWIALVVMAALLSLVATHAVATALAVRRIAYQVRDHDLSYRSGVFIQSVSTIPFVRVQHARIHRGPLQRRFGIATLEVNSAGPDLAIRGLGEDVADRLKALVVERAGDLLEDD